MDKNHNNILEDIKKFEISILIAASETNSRIQISKLDDVYSEIVKFLQSKVQAADKESMIIGGIIGGLEYIKRKYITYDFIKDPKKALNYT